MQHSIDPDHAKALVRRFQGDNFYVLDQDCRMIEIGDGCFNDPCLKGYCKADFFGKTLWDIKPQFKDSPFYYKTQQVLNTHQSVHFEHQSFFDSSQTLMIHMFPLDGGILVYTFNITSKIDVLNHLTVSNEKLKFLNDELNQLLYYMQHDLRNPLNTITVFLECLILDDSKFSLEDKDSIVQIFSAIEQMKTVMTGIRKMAEITQKLRMYKTFRLSDLVIMAIDTCMTREQNRKCVYKVKEVTIKGDVDLFQLAIFNLIENAWKFCQNQKVTEITFDYSTNDNGDPIFYIRDNGMGFPSSKSELIFEPFKRAHKKNQVEGTGLGLAIVKRAIKYHGGKVWAQSKPDQGATFYFTLPQQHFDAQNQNDVIITNNGGNNHEKEIPCVWPILQLDAQPQASTAVG